MNTRDMQIFMKIADYRSITRTAEDIQMTQPAVSNTLKRLEDEIGYPLFYRRGKWLILNEQGSLFYNAAQEFLGEAAHVQEGLRVEDHPKSEIVIKVYTHSDKLFDLLGSFTRENPDVRIVLRQGDVFQKENFRITDFQVLMESDRFENASFLPLEHRGALYAILPEQHPLTKFTQLTPADLRGEKFVFLQDSSATGMEATYKICVSSGIAPEVSMVTETNSSKFSAIRRGCGIGLAFDNALSLAPLIKDCKLVPVAIPLSVDWLCLTWQEGRLSDTGKQFLKFVKERG